MPANSNIVRSRRFLILGGYAALTAVFVLLVVLPYMRGMSASEANIAKTQQEINTNLQKKGELSKVEKNIELLKRQVANYPRLVPENQEIGLFLEQLSKELDAAGMKDIDHKALASQTLGKTQMLPIELHGNATFDQFRTFLVRLEHLQRMCSVGKLEVQADTEMSGKVNVDLTLFIYNTKPG